ncbi:MAG: hypothetical protein A4E67_02593 [Syntrophaceae bacterium PtaB.Bin038]|nr:MAG: hypothetical protein A4E67_02593 [Syntrophaceae bacterium PtaB.Bin038]
MILPVSSLAWLIASMERTISCIETSAFSTAFFVETISAFALCELSAFCLVMDEISSIDAAVSSSEEACSEAPSARCWLDAATWEAAEDT